MTIRYILAIALITPCLTVPSMAQQYVGGPKSSVATTRPMSSGGDIYAQGVRGEIYAPGEAIYAQGRADRFHAYRGGPKTVVPHGR